MDLNYDILNKNYKPVYADLIFVQKNTLIARLVRWFEKRSSKDTVFASHVMGFSSDKGNVIDCTRFTTVKEFKFSVDTCNHKFEIWRMKDLSDIERLSISVGANGAKSYVGKKYGYNKVLTHLLDMLLEKMFNKQIFFFRKLNHDNNYPTCSWVWGYAYYNGLLRHYRFGVLPKYADPNIMCKWVKEHPEEWELMYKKG